MKLLVSSARIDNEEQLQMVSGMLPLNRFVLKSRNWRFFKLPISEGIEPEKPLTDNSRSWRVEMLARNGESEPVSWVSMRVMEMIAFVDGSQETPDQLQW